MWMSKWADSHLERFNRSSEADETLVTWVDEEAGSAIESHEEGKHRSDKASLAVLPTPIQVSAPASVWTSPCIAAFTRAIAFGLSRQSNSLAACCAS